MKRFTKIAHSPASLKTKLLWSVDPEGGGTPIEHSLEIADVPPDAFLAALRALDQDAQEIFEAAIPITVLSISLSDSKGVCQCKMYGQVALADSNSPAFVHLPAKPAPRIAGPDDGPELNKNAMSEETMERLNVLVEASEAFVEWAAEQEPAQMKLFKPSQATGATQSVFASEAN